jgi:nifR3 family TIM-barrel protein
MKIGNIGLSNNIFLAPLAGVTDVGFRGVCKDYGCALTYTEMISAKGLYFGNKNTACLAQKNDSEAPVACQIFGSDPDIMAAAAQNAALKEFDIVDINMGCPVNKVTRAGEGCALMDDLPLSFKIISRVAKATAKPTTVKFRKGFKGTDNAKEFAKMCEQAGAAAIAVHPRTGDQMYGGTVDLSVLNAVASAVKIPVIASGDITDCAAYKNALELGCAAVMIGRASLGQPWIFKTLLSGEVYRPSDWELKGVIQKQIDILKAHLFAERYILGSMRKNIGWYLKGRPNHKKAVQAVNKITTLKDLENFLQCLF